MNVTSRGRSSLLGWNFDWEKLLWDSRLARHFYRDMRFVKQAFEAMGYRLLYSRNKQQPGYYLDGQPALSSEIKRVLTGSAAEVDERQIEIYRKLSFAERSYQGCSISDTAHKVVAYRIRQENQKLSIGEANRMAVQRAANIEGWATRLGLSSL